MKPAIELYDHAGLGLIIEYPSGVTYGNQTGGTSCLQPSTEGIFIPLRKDCLVEDRDLVSPRNKLAAYFEGPKWKGTGATNGLDMDDADFIDRLLSDSGLSPCMIVDRRRLHDSHEAWVRVTVLADEPGPCPIFSGFGPYPRTGILTWHNSD
jgi:hypothetical protein